MTAYIQLITAIAALLGAIAWPVAFLIVAYIFRDPLKQLLGRLRKGKVAGVEFELEQVAATADTKTGAITARQVISAARIKAQATDIGESELLRQLDALCLEYDSIRRSLPSSAQRTRLMTEVVVKMRAIGPSVIDRLEAYKGSGSPGSRLAAIAMMQMVTDCADLSWLLERFQESQPFLFYHAALALSNVANKAVGEKRGEVLNTAKEALFVIKKAGASADKDTIFVLQSIIGS